jgi:hypothetical protein
LTIVLAGVQGIGDANVAEIERWRVEDRLRVQSKKDRLLKELAGIRSRYFVDGFGRVVPNPPEEALEEVKRVDSMLAQVDEELRAIEAEAERRRYAPLDVAALAEQCRVELEELRQQRRVYCHRLYILRRTPEEQALRNVEARINEVENLLERYELAASAREELANREEVTS